MIWWVKLLHPKLSLIFPAFNEEHNIVELIEQALPFVVSHSAEIIVVDDGSTDNTVVQLQRYREQVILIQHERNKGYGAALRSGFAKARGTWIFFSDSDLQFRLDSLHAFWKYTENFDLIIGYRNPRRDPLLRIINAKIWASLVNHLFGLSIYDVNCAFKLIRAEALQQISLCAYGASINAELLKKMSGFRLIQLPVTHAPRLHGIQTGANPYVIFRALRELMALALESDSPIPKP